MSKIKILNTISFSLTNGKLYEVIKQNDWKDDEGNQQISITVLDDDGDEFIIVNSDEAEYQYITAH